VEQIYSDESLGQQHPTCDQVISNISTHNRFSGLNVDEHIEDAELVNATSQESQMPVRMEGKEARKVSPMQDQIEPLSKTKSKVTNSDNTKQHNQIGRPVKVAIVGDSMIKYVNPSKLRKSIIVRVSNGLFGSDSCKRTKFGPDVAHTIPFRFLMVDTPRDRLFGEIQYGRHRG
jgi:hypothetical protein